MHSSIFKHFELSVPCVHCERRYPGMYSKAQGADNCCSPNWMSFLMNIQFQGERYIWTYCGYGSSFDDDGFFLPISYFKSINLHQYEVATLCDLCIQEALASQKAFYCRMNGVGSYEDFYKILDKYSGLEPFEAIRDAEGLNIHAFFKNLTAEPKKWLLEDGPAISQLIEKSHQYLIHESHNITKTYYPEIFNPSVET